MHQKQKSTEQFEGKIVLSKSYTFIIVSAMISLPVFFFQKKQAILAVSTASPVKI
jgi:hypothetical protein